MFRVLGFELMSGSWSWSSLTSAMETSANGWAFCWTRYCGFRCWREPFVSSWWDAEWSLEISVEATGGRSSAGSGSLSEYGLPSASPTSMLARACSTLKSLSTAVDSSPPIITPADYF